MKHLYLSFSKDFNFSANTAIKHPDDFQFFVTLSKNRIKNESYVSANLQEVLATSTQFHSFYFSFTNVAPDLQLKASQGTLKYPAAPSEQGIGKSVEEKQILPKAVLIPSLLFSCDFNIFFLSLTVACSSLQFRQVPRYVQSCG